MKMQAIVLRSFGSYENLKPTTLPLPDPKANEVVVQIEAAAINPSDVVNIRGGFDHTLLPRVLGRDFAGRVVAGPEELIGEEVWGSGGKELGFTRHGTHAEYLMLHPDEIAIRPEVLSAEQAACIGVPFITAWSAIVDRGLVKPGEWVVISGAAGSVGDAAIQIATAHGARVIALLKDDRERERVERHNVAAIAQSDRNDLERVVEEATHGQGCALALDVVGGTVFKQLLGGLAKGGRLVVISAAGGRTVTLDLQDFYRRDLVFHGLNSANLSIHDNVRILNALAPTFASGALRPPTIVERYPLEAAAQGYEAVAKGAPGKVVLLPES